ncbi:MAG TPA: prolipoprotein diacylglyceryl transferase family protein [Candidatus Angelobacter sp.]|nr:prolipoprotein diacylglyceryl transferase family protein [Candidatus Angelobacter sp.]
MGGFDLPTFGLLMLLAFAAAYFALEAEVKRRKLPIDVYNVVALVAFAGIVGAKIWHVIDTPADRLNLDILRSFGSLVAWFRGGFAWFGGFVAGISMLLYLARRYRVGMLTMLDVSSSAAAVGYAVGRIGCLISGDGDYGRPTHLPWGMAFPDGLVPTTGPNGTCALNGWPQNCAVHPTPIYEFIVCVLICWYIWRRGTRSIQHPLAPGVIVGEFLILFGLERFLVEFIRINPRILWGMSNAQMAALLTVIAGIILLMIARRRFRKIDPVHKVLDHVVQHGNQETKPEYHRATPECPYPERWRMFDTMTAEVEVLDFLKCLMTTVKPNLVVETGTFLAVSTIYMAEGLKQNGSGKIITCEPDKEVFAKAREKIESSGLKKFIDFRCESSLETRVSGTIDVLFCDSLPELREPEVRHFLPQINSNGLILMHDASSHLKTVREAALRLEQEGLVSVVLLPTPRGLVIAQKRDGRK